MLGAIAGDVIGSVHEYSRTKTTDFPLFTKESFYTDDSVLTVAVGAALLGDGDYGSLFREFGLRHSGRGYGFRFHGWLQDPSMGPY